MSRGPADNQPQMTPREEPQMARRNEPQISQMAQMFGRKGGGFSVICAICAICGVCAICGSHLRGGTMWEGAR